MFTKKENTLFIYQDQGVSTDSFRQFSNAFKVHPKFSSFKLKKLTALDIMHHQEWKKASLLIFPGGRDLPYHEKLKGQGIQRLKSYVQNGGAFLGVCAGAYFACHEILFEKGTPQEVHQKRELSFFPGQAIGAVYPDPPFSYEAHQSARAARVSSPVGELFVYYNGGCLFSSDQTYPHIKVLSKYQDLPSAPPSIIECQVGQGRALLSGVHFEVMPEEVRDKEDLYELLKQEEEKRRALFEELLTRLLI